MKAWIAGMVMLLACGCGAEVERLPGLESRLQLRIHTPPYQDAFDGVSTLRMTLKLPDGRELITSVDVSATEFFVDGSAAQGVVLVLEGVGVDGQTVISSGQSTPFDLDPTEPAEVDLLFARKGEFARLLGDLGHPRFGHSASGLPDGRVLVFGGASQGDLGAPAEFPPPEIYDLKSQTSCIFSEEPCPFYAGADRRYGHTATPTKRGKAVIFGGEDDQGELVGPLLVFDPQGDEFYEKTVDPGEVVPRAYHAAAEFLLDGAREAILFAGGEVDGATRRVPTGNGLVFDVQAEAFTRTDLSMIHPRRRHSLTVLGGDESWVLAVGGEGEGGLVSPGEFSNGESFWVVEPGGGGRNGLLNPRVNHSAVAVPDGVMILGGDDQLVSIDAPEMYLVGSAMGTGIFALQIQAAHQEHSARRGLIAAQLPSGGLLYAGGEDLTGFSRDLLDTAEVLHLEEGTLDAAFSGVASLGQKLSVSTVTTLPGGALLITGGMKPGVDQPVASAEVWYYNP